MKIAAVDAKQRKCDTITTHGFNQRSVSFSIFLSGSFLGFDFIIVLFLFSCLGPFPSLSFPNTGDLVNLLHNRTQAPQATTHVVAVLVHFFPFLSFPSWSFLNALDSLSTCYRYPEEKQQHSGFRFLGFLGIPSLSVFHFLLRMLSFPLLPFACQNPIHHESKKAQIGWWRDLPGSVLH